MKPLIAAAALLLATPAIAQTSPYKLLILWGTSGVAIVDYPTIGRCEAALRVLERRKAEEVASRQPKRTEGGGVIFPPPWQMEMACIPG